MTAFIPTAVNQLLNPAFVVSVQYDDDALTITYYLSNGQAVASKYETLNEYGSTVCNVDGLLRGAGK